MNTLRTKLLVLVASLLTASVLVVPGAGPAQAAAGDPWLVGYYAVYNRNLMPPSTVPWPLMTHIAIGAALPRSNGTIDTSFYMAPGEGKPFVRDLVKRARSNGVSPILMLGGAGTRQQYFDAMAPATRQTFVNNIVALMRNWGFAGVNVDWEEQPDGDYPRLQLLVSMLRKALPTAPITVSAFWTSVNFPDVNPAWKAIAAKANRIDLMTYGMSGDWQGWKSWHSSALFGAKTETPSDVATSVRSYRLAGVPASKLNVGIGFYGQCWRGVNGPNQDISGAPTEIANDNIMSYANIMKDYYSAGAYRYDATAQAPYLSYNAQTGPQGCTYISYENIRSVREKAKWTVARNLGGAIVWEIAEGRRTGVAPSQTNELLRAAHVGLGL